MNFAEAFQNFLSKITGQTDRLETVTSKLEAALTSSEDVKAENQRLTTENATLKDSLKAALEEKGSPQEAVKSAVFGERTRIASAVESAGLFKFGFDGEGKPEMSLTDAGKVQFVNAEAARVLASSGHAPLPVTVDSGAPGTHGATAGNGRGRTKTTWAK